MKRVDIFTDGACKGNPGPGGWAALLRMGKHEKELSGGEALAESHRRIERRVQIGGHRVTRQTEQELRG